jgi:SAM-dependent methyltransferase
MLPLIEAGIPVTGVDCSPAMLAFARRKLGKDATLIQGDMRTVTLPERYGLILITINTFMHLLTTEDQLAALSNLSNYIAPEGKLIIDLPAGDELAHQDADALLTLEKTFLDPENGHQILKFVASRVDWFRQRQEITYVFEELLENGTVQRTLAPMTLRYVFRYELELLLQQTGYQLETLYSDYDLSPYRDGGPRMLAVATPAQAAG